MKYLFDEDTETEVESPRAGLGRSSKSAPAETEITLGMRSLLGIFFGLILICGIFFGLGYSVGRGSSPHPAIASAAPTPDSSPAADSQPKPSATDVAETSPAPVPGDNDEQGGTASVPDNSSTPAPAAETPDQPPAPQPVVRNSAARAASKPAVPAKPTASTPAPAASSSGPDSAAAGMVPVSDAEAGPKTFMVQVAAVRLPDDANILIQALRKHGYSAAIRHEPQDQLLHIQIGPFGTRAEANNMRSRLLTDGYNAVLK